MNSLHIKSATKIIKSPVIITLNEIKALLARLVTKFESEKAEYKARTRQGYDRSGCVAGFYFHKKSEQVTPLALGL
ncbi:hypothetical protein ACULTK_003128 [Yersinia enterocolitica]|uniref:Uncharacterized protein n=1 Tax=Yersinia enterocolitica TaxID=630 RepID=A0AAD2V0K6_YEREN|nr:MULTISPECIES: hypothetical protein [Yersinia]AKF39877.1 hypothetical protein FORC2_3730 [Yersinia enterocolitica]ALG43547.1 hypothetical protein LI89_02040 [Yersinia enterocolitica]EKN3338535.1 hypothetical protein [Yersinia enterocolitica]EKN3387446.1 hypothetical protein [Yersinia enterocolitica]EKN3394009.1 hypothetical protein [Yersinia enterocolitica]